MRSEKSYDRPYHHGNLKAALLEAAKSAISLKGVGGLSLRAVARDIGVDVSAAYRHYPSKDALVGGVALAAFAELADKLAEAKRSALGSTGKSEREILMALGLEYVQFAAANPHLFTAMFDQSGIREVFADEARGSGGQTPLALLGSSMPKLKAKAERAGQDADRLPHVFWISLHGLAVLYVQGFVDLDEAAMAHLVRRIVKLLADGIEGGEASS